jgi:putative spermidine/putrescine transport system substrate-binding protein
MLSRHHRIGTTLHNLRLWFQAAVTVVALGIVPGPSLAQSQNVVVFAGWGGSIQKAQRAIFFDAFEKQTGIKVIDIPDVQIAKIKAMVDSGDVQWDVVQSLGMWVPQGEKQNLWEPLDYKTIDKSNVPATMAGPYAIGNSTYGMIVAYNKLAFAGREEPKSWTDYWNVKKFPGRRALQDAPRYTLESALLADGVPPEKLYPLDVDRAFRSLDRIKTNVNVWFKQWPQVPVLLSSQEIVMSLMSHTRILTAVKEERAPLGMAWGQSLMTVDYLAVPRGARHKENAMKLINWMTNAKLQAELARDTGIGPSNTAALEFLTEAERERLPNYHYNKGESVLVDYGWWSANDERIQEQWNSWKLKQ